MERLPAVPACAAVLTSLVLAAATQAGEISVEWLRPRDGADATFQEGGMATLTLRVGNAGSRPVALLRVRGEGALDQPLELTEPREGALVHDPVTDCYELDTEQLIVSRVRAGVLLPGEQVTFAAQLRLPPARRAPAQEGAGAQDAAAASARAWALVTGIAIDTIDIAPGERPRIHMADGEHDREGRMRWLPLTPEILRSQSAFPALSRTFVLRDTDAEVSTTRIQIELACRGSRMTPAVENAAAAGRTPFWSERFDTWLAATDGGDDPGAIALPLGDAAATPLPEGWSFRALLFAEGLLHTPLPVLTPGRADLFHTLLLSHQLGIDDLSLLYAEDCDAFCELVARHELSVTTAVEPVAALVVRGR